MSVASATSGPEPAGAVSPRRYRAFFSYSHADTVAGTRLFRKVDGYRPPKALRGQMTPAGPVPGKLYPCFRDRDEESTAPDIRAEVERALSSSDCLVVVCSPASAQSRWVGWEIETFRRLRGDAPIHAVIVAGEPEHSFPPALRALVGTPLAADLRPQGDGWVNGPLKLIAGILGLTFGDLKDREIARARARTRLAATIAGGFAFLLVGACAVGWVALDRSEKLQTALISLLEQIASRVDKASDSGPMTTADVERELGFARGLTDAAFALAPDSPRLLQEQARLLSIYSSHYLNVGKSIEARKTAAQAARILDALNRRLPFDQQRERFRVGAINAEGDALLAMGDRPGAKQRYEAGLKANEDLQKRNPRNADLLKDLSVSYDNLGKLALEVGEIDEASRRFDASLKIAEELVTLGPDITEFQRDLTISHDWVGDIAQFKGDRRAAKTHYLQALAIRERLINTSPENLGLQRDIIVSYAKLGDLAMQASDTEEAARQYSSALAVAKKVTLADPGNAQFLATLVGSELLLGGLAMGSGDFPGAKARYDEALQDGTRLANLDLANVEYQTKLYAAHIGRGDLGILQDELEEAGRHYAGALEIMEKLARLDSTDATVRGYLADAHRSLGDAAMRGGDLAKARSEFVTAQTERQKLVAADPANSSLQRDLSVLHDRLGDLEKQAKNPAAAKVHYGEILKVSERLAAAEPDNAGFKRDFMIISSKLGDLALSQNDKAEARRHYEATIRMAETLAQLDPANAMFQRDLAGAYTRLADVTNDRSLWRKARPIVDKLAREGGLLPSDADWLKAVRRNSR